MANDGGADIPTDDPDLPELVDLTDDLDERIRLVGAPAAGWAAQRLFAGQIDPPRPARPPLRLAGEGVEVALQALQERVDRVDDVLAGVAEDLAALREAAVVLPRVASSVASLQGWAADAVADVRADLATMAGHPATEPGQGALTAADAVPPRTGPVLPQSLDDHLQAVDRRLASLQAVVGDVASSVIALRDERAELSERVERLASEVHEVREHRPDVTSSLRTIADLVQGHRAVATDIQRRLDALSTTVGDHTDALTARWGPTARQNADVLDGPGAALIASAVSAMSRLEGRIEGEFGGVERQVEALGSLLGQVIDAVQRLEQQVAGTQPHSERLRDSAARVVAAWRGNVRERPTSGGGARPELRSGRTPENSGDQGD
jgi:hypothetical protein